MNSTKYYSTRTNDDDGARATTRQRRTRSTSTSSLPRTKKREPGPFRNPRHPKRRKQCMSNQTGSSGSAGTKNRNSDVESDSPSAESSRRNASMTDLASPSTLDVLSDLAGADDRDSHSDGTDEIVDNCSGRVSTTRSRQPDPDSSSSESDTDSEEEALDGEKMLVIDSEDEEQSRIPSFRTVWPTLHTLGFKKDGECRYYLPQHRKPLVGFQSTRALQEYLCSHGVPLLPGMKVMDGELVLQGDTGMTILISESETRQLRSWVRYSIVVPLLDTGTRVIPELETVNPSDSTGRKIWRSLGFVDGNSKYLIPGDANMIRLHDVEHFVWRNGLPSSLLASVNADDQLRVDALRLLLAVSENRDFNTFIESERPKQGTSQSPKGRKLTVAALTGGLVESLDRSYPPLKRHDVYLRKKSRTYPSALLNNRQGSLTRTHLPDGSEVKHYFNVMGGLHTDRGHTIKEDEFQWSPSHRDLWGGYLGWRPKLGRAYFDSFRVKDTTILVGDFIEMQEGGSTVKESCRVVSSFQALKSFRGVVDILPTGDEMWGEYQKRGHAYIQVAPLRLENGKMMLAGSSTDCPGSVDARLRWLLDPGLAIRKLSIADNSDGCFQGRFDNQLLARSVLHLTKENVGFPWPRSWKVRHVIITSSKTKQRNCNGIISVQDDAYDSSDDSDPADSDEDDTSVLTRKQQTNTEGSAYTFDKPLPMVLFPDVYSRLNDNPRKEEEEKEAEAIYLSATTKSVRSALRPLCPVHVHFAVTTQPNPEPNDQSRDLLESVKTLIGPGASFKGLQEQVCQAAINKRCVAYIAPCGYGKSLCFQVAALHQGGITLVVEPLKELIRNQIANLSSLLDLFEVEQLFSYEDLKSRSDGVHAENRLMELVKLHEYESSASEQLRKPMILFSVPELVVQRRVLSALGRLNRLGVLTRCVVDEFDTDDDSYSGRRAYKTLLGDLGSKLNHQVPFMFLSGTLTSAASLDKLLDMQNVPEVFVEPKVMRNSLSFSVERKASTQQVAERIYHILEEFRKRHKLSRHPKCFVYCSTPKNCMKLAEKLRKMKGDLKVATTTGSDTPGDNRQKIEKFKSGEVSILCTTKVLGRGVHIPDIRFVFHAWLPLSLGDLIQETGRAGRDGRESHCTVFFRPQDIGTVKNVRGGLPPNQKLDKVDEKEIADLLAYCTESLQCRSKLLARYAVQPFSSHVEGSLTDCGKCDNCREKGVANEAISVSTHVDRKFLEGLVARGELSRKGKQAITWKPPGGTSLLVDVQKMLSQPPFRSQQTPDIILRYNERGPCMKEPTQQREPEQPHRTESAVVEFEFAESSESAAKHELTVPKGKEGRLAVLHTQLPTFLLCFEGARLLSKHNPNINELREKIGWQVSAPIHGQIEDWKYLHWVFSAHLDARSLGSMESIASNGDCEMETLEEGLYFHATLNSEARAIELHPPEKAIGRRIFRRFGSHRFLHLNIDKKCSIDSVCSLMAKPLSIAGRTFKFLWCKQNTSPQCYVLFAEDGKGIKQPTKVTDVWQILIPEFLNESLSLEKAFKRMKLSFSKTVATARIPAESLRIVDDIFGKDNHPRTNGSGLISPEAIDLVWHRFCQAHGTDVSEAENCPWSSFQGRIGGFKGHWVLDAALGDGMKLVCRHSQKKFNVDGRCLEKRSCKDREAAHDTMEVCSWDTEPKPAVLNIRLIQLLEEHLSNIDDNRKTLLTLVKQCVDQGLREVAKIDTPLRTRQAELKREKLGDWRSVLFRMQIGGVDKDEPVHRAFHKEYRHQEVYRMRDDAHYPLPPNMAYNLRLIPDHTGLLDEGEAYVAIHDSCKRAVEMAHHLLAMRSPAYFPGDLRKLKVAHYRTLEDRWKKLPRSDATTLEDEWYSRNDGSHPDPLRFFRDLKIGLVLGTKGKFCEADAMSGGDFDGDCAWVCWWPELVSIISRAEPENTKTDKFQTRKSDEACVPFYGSSIEQRLRYALNFRFHQTQLGYLSNMLSVIIDRHGFHHESTREFGTQAFLQVDHPYYLCEPSSEVADSVRAIGLPHWSSRSNKQPNGSNQIYPSERVLGIIYDYVEGRLEEATKENFSSETKPEKRILDFVKQWAEDRPNEIRELQRKVEEDIRDVTPVMTDREYACLRQKLMRHASLLGRGVALAKVSDMPIAAVLYAVCIETRERQRLPWLLFTKQLTDIINRSKYGLGDAPATYDGSAETALLRRRPHTSMQRESKRGL